MRPSAFAPSMFEAKYGLVVLMTEATRRMSSFAIGSCDPPALVEEQAETAPSAVRLAMPAARRRRTDLVGYIWAP